MFIVKYLVLYFNNLLFNIILFPFFNSLKEGQVA